MFTIARPQFTRIGRLLAATIPMASGAFAEELWDHLPTAEHLIKTRGLTAGFDEAGGQRSLQVEVGGSGPSPSKGVTWVSIPPPSKSWDFSRAEHVQAEVRNTGSTPVDVTLWVVSSHGWAAVGASSKIPVDETKTLTCNLRETYPDGTPKIDPTRIQEIRVMLHRATKAKLRVTDLTTAGVADEWTRPMNHLDVPDMVNGTPAPGKRVRYPLENEEKSDIYGALYLPTDWKPEQRYPVVVEFPGNQFFSATQCWSTGRPEQCVMGYGMTKGLGAIWISLPFIDRPNEAIAETGFGSNNGDDTIAYTKKAVEEICRKWGGDSERLFLSGFSRGAIACGYIGLGDAEIASLWRGFIACQHYDGSGWRQSSMDGAVARAPRFKGKAIFQIDNAKTKYLPVVEATHPSVEWTWTESKLDYHATAMFLDDRPSTKELREWFRVQSSAP